MKALVILILLASFVMEVVDSSTSFVRSPEETSTTAFNQTPSTHVALPATLTAPGLWEISQQIFSSTDIQMPRLNPPVFEINRPPIA